MKYPGSPGKRSPWPRRRCRPVDRPREDLPDAPVLLRRLSVEAGAGGPCPGASRYSPPVRPARSRGDLPRRRRRDLPPGRGDGAGRHPGLLHADRRRPVRVRGRRGGQLVERYLRDGGRAAVRAGDRGLPRGPEAAPPARGRDGGGRRQGEGGGDLHHRRPHRQGQGAQVRAVGDGQDPPGPDLEQPGSEAGGPHRPDQADRDGRGDHRDQVGDRT